MILVEDARKLLLGAAGLTLVIALFALAFVGAQHESHPYQIPVDLIGPAEGTTPVLDVVSRQTGDTLKLRQVPDHATAQQDLLERRVYAAYDPVAAQLLLASAASPSIQQLTTTIFTSTAHAADRQLSVTDLAPLPAGDPRGLAAFLLTLPLIIGGIGTAVLFHLLGHWLRYPIRALTLIGYGAVAALVAALIADPLTGALTGHFWALTGVAWLTLMAVALPTTALIEALGIAGAPLGALLFVLLGNSSSGATSAPELLPAYSRTLGQQMPPGAAVQAFRNIHYFDSHAMGVPLLVLSIWATTGLFAFQALAWTKTRRQPVTNPKPAGHR